MSKLQHRSLASIAGGATRIQYTSIMQPYVDAGVLPRWYQFNEPSGTTLINYGSGGAALNGVITGATVAQTGQRGAVNAYLFDGNSDYVTTPGHVSTAGLTFTQMFLIKAITNIRYGRWWGVGTASDAARSSGTGTINAPSLFRDLTGTDIDMSSSTDQGLGVWQAVFFVHDEAGDRKCRIYGDKTGAGVLLLGTSGSASSGTMVQAGGGHELFGCREVPDNYANILLDEYGFFTSALTTLQMSAITLSMFS